MTCYTNVSKSLRRASLVQRTRRQTVAYYSCFICCAPHLTGKCGTRPFSWWVRAQGRSPHAPGISQKCLRPRRHSRNATQQLEKHSVNTAAAALRIFVAASHQTRLDTRSKSRRPIKVGIMGGEVRNEPRLEPCLSVLLIGSLSAMWVWWGKQFHEPKCGSGHVCQFAA